MFLPSSKEECGFSLPELIVVIAIIAVLFAVVLIGLDPTARIAGARDGERRRATHDILQALASYAADNSGNVPAAIDALTASIQIVGTNVSGCGSVTASCAGYTEIASSCADLSSLVDAYLESVPIDPTTGTSGNTRYYIQKSYSNRLEVGACDPEKVASIVERR
ncbi:type II secretion system protein [Patescibacteria group bacterium]|nr:type II secretion system protein [Patescibacteria group bacterium]